MGRGDQSSGVAATWASSTGSAGRTRSCRNAPTCSASSAVRASGAKSMSDPPRARVLEPVLGQGLDEAADELEAVADGLARAVPVVDALEDDRELVGGERAVPGQ